MPQIRTDLDSIPAYVPGRSAPGSIKLASNEASEGPLPSVRKAIAEAALDGHRYPDISSFELREAIAAIFGTDPAHIAVGCGSSALCQQIIQATCTQGDEVMFPWRSFEAYPILTRVALANPVAVPLAEDHSVDTDALLAAITERTRLIFLCTPNNPTGPALTQSAVIDFLDRVPERVTVALDEAYYEYSRGEDRVEGFGLALERPNVVALRTMSKAYGMAGLRIGYMAGPAALVEAVNKMAVPFSVSAVAQAGALESLSARDELLARTDAVVAERERCRDALSGMGFSVPVSQANFLWLPLGDDALRFNDWCTARGLLVRAFAGDGVRVTIGTPEEMAQFLSAAREWADSEELVAGED
ncbi:histidinol-phosphate transaminase [Dietzia sp.]|uniref:histidinol-phosphate transaminase n=1 Tax=Dietzia sp. TaxID=1871616 RepID=UPI002FDB428F